MAEVLPRFYAEMQKIADDRKLAQILLESEAMDAPATVARATLAGDPRRLRGIPAVGRGCSGAISGTRPGENLLRESRRRS